jgi:hypothetical protein
LKIAFLKKRQYSTETNKYGIIKEIPVEEFWSNAKNKCKSAAF